MQQFTPLLNCGTTIDQLIASGDTGLLLAAVGSRSEPRGGCVAWTMTLNNAMHPDSAMMFRMKTGDHLRGAGDGGCPGP